MPTKKRISTSFSTGKATTVDLHERIVKAQGYIAGGMNRRESILKAGLENEEQYCIKCRQFGIDPSTEAIKSKPAQVKELMRIAIQAKGKPPEKPTQAVPVDEYYVDAETPYMPDEEPLYMPDVIPDHY